jgi:hypothetical protein
MTSSVKPSAKGWRRSPGKLSSGAFEGKIRVGHRTNSSSIQSPIAIVLAVLLLALSACIQQRVATGESATQFQEWDEETIMQGGIGIVRTCLRADPYSEGWCLGYLLAIAEGGPVGLFCVPDDTLASEVRRVFLAWAEAYPEYLSRPRNLTVWAALREHWPCETPGWY